MTLPLSDSGRRYGFKPSKPDARDFGLASMMRLARFETPPSVDLERDCGAVRDQGDEGSCTAHAGVGLREYLARKFQSQTPTLSPTFLYYLSRQMDAYSDANGGAWPTNEQLLAFADTNFVDDSGSYGRTACRTLNQFGTCTIEELPYTPGLNVNVMPPKEIFAPALGWKSGAYHALHTVSDMRSCLASGYVFCLGFTVYDSFEGKWADGVTMPMPDPKEQVLGGHEVLCIGYDDSRGALKIRNSWGPSFGDGGNFWYPYSCAANPDITTEAWIQHLSGPWR
jgi:C1A family cysteine protease